MLTNNGKYYLYRHIRLDKNIPFYIGIGSKNKNDLKYGSYDRAFKSCNRNNYWKNITNKTKYEVEILLETDNYDFLKEKEEEFIKLYGRVDLKTGTLANMTEGGETGNRGKRIKVFDINKNFLSLYSSITEACDILNLNRSKVAKVILNKIYVLPRKKLILCPEDVDVEDVEVKEEYGFRRLDKERLLSKSLINIWQ